MKKLRMVLPLAILLAYCSGPNNTQTTTDTDIDATSASTTTTVTDDVATTSTDVSDVNTNTTTVTTEVNHADRPIGNVTVDHSSSVINPIPNDPNDPMYQHWQRTNAQNWTWDPVYTGYRPMAGSYNTAINGDWQLIMTPELVTAWRTDDSRSLWMRDGDTYLSASESFNTKSNLSTGVSVNSSTTGTTVSESTSVGVAKTGTVNGTNTNSAATLNGQYSSTFDPQSETFLGNNKSSVTVNGSAQAGTLSSNNSSSSTSGLNNNASVNAGTANTMNGTNTMSTQGTVSAGVSGSTSTTGSLDVNSINYNASNGNLYQLPKFNLYLDNGSFTGYTGCNGISGRVEVSGTGLRFLNTTPSTAIDCMGGFDESQLVDMLRKIDSYAYVGDELHLMQGSQVLLRFKRNSPDTTLK